MKHQTTSEPEAVEIESGEIRLSGDLYLPSSVTEQVPGVVICHGLGSRKENHADFAHLLQSRGWAALAFDLRGHGASEGKLDGEAVGDILAAVDYLADHPGVDPSRIALRGSSLGGQLSVHAAAESDTI